MDNLQMLWSELAYAIPALLVYGVGFILAVVNWNRAPTAALMTALGIGVLTLALIAGVALPLVAAGPGLPGGVMSVASGFLTILRTAGMLCILAAVFVERPPPADSPRDRF